MKTEHAKRLEYVLERKLTDAEKERLDRLKTALDIADDDAMWDVLAAMEYQRVYYEELPGKIAAASGEILQNLSLAAEKEAGRAQSRLAESVAEQAKKLSLRVNLETLLPMGLCVLACLLLYGCLSMWAGFRMGSGQARDPLWILRMPSGVLMGGLLLGGGLFLGVHAAREFAEGNGEWKKKSLAALGLLVAGGALVGLGV